MPWAAILLTVAAATGNNVGKALQKEATRCARGPLPLRFSARSNSHQVTRIPCFVPVHQLEQNDILCRSLPRFSLDPGITRQYLRSRAWLAGLASDVGGAVLMVAAFSLAPVRPVAADAIAFASCGIRLRLSGLRGCCVIPP